MIERVISGGQAGTDQAEHRAAVGAVSTSSPSGSGSSRAGRCDAAGGAGRRAATRPDISSATRRVVSAAHPAVTSHMQPANHHGCILSDAQAVSTAAHAADTASATTIIVSHSVHPGPEGPVRLAGVINPPRQVMPPGRDLIHVGTATRRGKYLDAHIRSVGHVRSRRMVKKTLYKDRLRPTYNHAGAEPVRAMPLRVVTGVVPGRK
jgi:hypothetical protein